MAEEVFPVDIDNLIEQVWTSMWEATIKKLDKELRPFLEKLNLQEPGQYEEDPSVKQLFNWLVDQKRTSEEFNYVFGPVVQSMNRYNERISYVEYFTELDDVCPMFLGLLSAEALAVKSPVLQGLWENVAWFLVKFTADYKYQIEKLVSTRLSNWIIRMMADSDLCPNPYLRLEFMNIFGSIANVNYDNEAQALKAVMITCSTLNRVPMKKYICRKDKEDEILWSISLAFGRIEYLYTELIDQELSDNMLLLLSPGISGALCLYQLDSNLNKGSFELNIIKVIFQTISGYAHQLYQDFHQDSNAITIPEKFFVISSTLNTVIFHFKKTCQTPQLVDSTASCIMDIVDLALMFNIDELSNQNLVYPGIILQVEELLVELCERYEGSIDILITITPVGQTLIHRYQARLSKLRQQLEQLSFFKRTSLRLDHYYMICRLLYHCTYSV